MGWRGGITLHLQVGGIWGPVEDSVTSDGGGGEEEHHGGEERQEEPGLLVVHQGEEEEGREEERGFEEAEKLKSEVGTQKMYVNFDFRTSLIIKL